MFFPVLFFFSLRQSLKFQLLAEMLGHLRSFCVSLPSSSTAGACHCAWLQVLRIMLLLIVMVCCGLVARGGGLLCIVFVWCWKELLSASLCTRLHSECSYVLAHFILTSTEMGAALKMWEWRTELALSPGLHSWCLCLQCLCSDPCTCPSHVGSRELVPDQQGFLNAL